MKPLDAAALADPTGRAASRLRPLLAALQLASPALPVGGFVYSQGLEKAIEDRRVADAVGAFRWIGDLLTHVLSRMEAPLWLRAYDAMHARDGARFAAINDELLATRETMELRAETRQMGASLARLLPYFAAGRMADLPPLPEPVAYAAAFAAACVQLDIDREAGLAAYLWSWAENQTLAAVKTIPLGHSDGQRLLLALHAPLEAAVATAMGLRDDELGSAPLGATLASMNHETMYSRLYRS